MLLKVTQLQRALIRNDIYLLIPFSVVLVSVPILISGAAVSYAFKSRQAEGEIGSDAYEGEDRPSASIVARNGGATMFSFMIARVFGCAALVAFSLPSLIRSYPGIRPPVKHCASSTLVDESILASNVSNVIRMGADVR